MQLNNEIVRLSFFEHKSFKKYASSKFNVD